MITLLDIWKVSKEKGEPLLGDIKLDFLADYKANYESYDRNIAKQYGIFYPIWNLNYEDSTDNVWEEFKKDVQAILNEHKFEYAKLWALCLTDYDPIENYDRNETHTETNSGSDSEDLMYGAQTTNTNYGERIGTSDTGASESTSAESKAAMNGSLTPLTKQTINNGARTDKNTQASVTDIVNMLSHDDTKVTTHGHVVTINGRVHGNIGVTTTQQMMTQELVFWQDFNYWDIIMDDIVSELCSLHEPMED